MNIEAILQRAIEVRKAQRLTVEVIVDGHTFLRHCVDEADRDAYMARAVARGETPRIVEG